MAAVVTLLARGSAGGGDIAEGLPMSVLHLEAVIRAKAAGDLVAEVVPTAPPAPPVPQAPPPEAKGSTKAKVTPRTEAEPPKDKE